MDDPSIDRFRELLHCGQGVGALKTGQLREAITTSLPQTTEGDIFWSERPMAKKWFWPRRGKQGLRSLLHDLPVEFRRAAYLLRSDQDEAIMAPVGEIFKHIFEFMRPDTSLVILPENGRWLVELSRDEYLYFDFSIPDEKEFHGLFGACPL